MQNRGISSALFCLILTLAGCANNGKTVISPPDLILHNAKILTVDPHFSIQQALAIRDGRIQRVGSNADVLALRAPDTTVLDLHGHTVVPGLIDSHVHPGAAMTEFDHAVPE